MQDAEQELRRRDLAIDQRALGAERGASACRSTRRPRVADVPERPDAAAASTEALRAAYADNPVLRGAGRGAAAPRGERDVALAEPPAALLRRRRDRPLHDRGHRAADARHRLRRLRLGPRHRHADRAPVSPRRAPPPSRTACASSASSASSSSAVRGDASGAAAERLAALATAEAAVGQAEENLRIRRQQFDVGRAAERRRARRRAPARLPARHARDRALPGADAARRAAAADGPAGRPTCWRTGGDSMMNARRVLLVPSLWSPCSPSVAAALWRQRSGADPLHRLRRGRGAHPPERGDRPGRSRSPFGEGDAGAGERRGRAPRRRRRAEPARGEAPADRRRRRPTSAVRRSRSGSSRPRGRPSSTRSGAELRQAEAAATLAARSARARARRS